jgi:hypothetical protein
LCVKICDTNMVTMYYWLALKDVVILIWRHWITDCALRFDVILLEWHWNSDCVLSVGVILIRRHWITDCALRVVVILIGYTDLLTVR